jgi:hypothetical protein
MIELLKIAVRVFLTVRQGGAKYFFFAVFKFYFDQPAGNLGVLHVRIILQLCPVFFGERKSDNPFLLVALGTVLHFQPPIFFEADTKLDAPGF